MTEVNDPESAFQRHFLPIAGIALAGVIQVSSQTGPFSLWNVMIGLPLVLLLAVFKPQETMTRTERFAWAVTWGLILISTFGVFLQAIYRAWKGLPGVFPPFYDAAGKELTNWEAPHEYYFTIWCVISALAYLYFYLRNEKGSAC